MTRAERELELTLRQVDHIVDRWLAEVGESEVERMALVGLLQGLARAGSGLGRVAGGLSRLSSLGRVAGSAGRAAGAVSRVAGRRTYPRFTTPTRADMPLVRALAKQLSRDSKLRIRTDTILDAPWIGRGTPRSTSEGWLRDSSAFWRAFARHAPAANAALAGTHRVTPAYARLMRWPKSTVGQQLVHHHILNSHFVVPLPAGAHGAEVHRIATVLGRP